MKFMIYILFGILLILLIIFMIGLFLPRKEILTKQTVYHAPIKSVYNTVTDNTDWKYRTSLDDLKIIETNGSFEIWEEVSKGNTIRFQTEKKIPFTFYSFQMDSKLFKGSWFAEFESINDEKTCFKATEVIEYKNPLTRIIGYIFMDLDKFMETYQKDLREKLENNLTQLP